MKLLLLPLATTTTTTIFLFLLLGTANGQDNVYDVVGKQLVAGGKFYIVPYAYANEGGGFGWKRNSNNGYYIYQLQSNIDFGLPTTFYPVKAGQNAITLSTEINIVFPDEILPSSSNVWKVENNKDVLLGGTKGGTDRKSVFTLKELDTGGYSINYCTSATTCSGLGIDPYSGPLRKLVVNASLPLAVAFEPKQIFLQKSSIFAA